MNDPEDQTYLDEEEAAEKRAVRYANNTPADDRLLAMRILRDIVANPAAKPQDRKSAADSLLKEAQASGTVTDAELQAFDMTDAQLLDEIRQAQLARAQPQPAIQPALSAARPSQTVEAARGSAGIEPAFSLPPDARRFVPRGLASLDGIADIDPLAL